jgi:hypothetical protein
VASDAFLNRTSKESNFEKLIPNQPVLALTARTWALQNCMSLISNTKTGPESGFMSLGNSFIFNNMAERVGFEPVSKRQTKDLTEHGQQFRSL